MCVILDTNVLLAALISPHAALDAIYRAWQAGRFELVTSTAQLDELKRVSRYPKLKAILPPHRVGMLVNHLRHAQVLEQLPPLPDSLVIDDADDGFLLRMALAAEADWLLTGDRRAGLLRLGHLGCTRIATPGLFVRECLGKV